METLADIVAAGRDRDGAVLTAAERSAPYTYGEFSTNAWKAGNILRHYGVRPDARLALVIGPKDPDENDEPGYLGTAADPLLALLGGAALGTTVDVTPAQPVDARAIVLPNAWLDRYEVEPGCSRLAYGGPPGESGVAHFERELWSENPIEPPDPVQPGDTVLQVDGTTFTHEQLVDAGRAVADEYGLTAGDSVALDAPLTSAGAVAGGIVAPLVVGGTLLLGAADPLSTEATYVLSDSASGERVVDPETVL